MLVPANRRHPVATWTPDPTFYPSPRLAAKAPPEKHAYVAEFDPGAQAPGRLAVVDVNPGSSTYAQIVGRTAMPMPGDELHHFGWNACSSCLCPNAPHPARGAPLPDRAGAALLEHPHPRHQARPEKAQADPDDRRQGDRRQGRLLPPAHRALRPRRHLRHGPRQRARARRPAASSSWTTRRSTCSAAGRSTAGPSSSPTTRGGIWATTPW